MFVLFVMNWLVITFSNRIVKVRETRLTGILSHILIGLSVFLIPYPMAYIPTAVLNGLFLYMAITSLNGNQMFERITLLFMEQVKICFAHSDCCIYLIPNCFDSSGCLSTESLYSTMPPEKDSSIHALSISPARTNVLFWIFTLAVYKNGLSGYCYPSTAIPVSGFFNEISIPTLS